MTRSSKAGVTAGLVDECGPVEARVPLEVLT